MAFTPMMQQYIKIKEQYSDCILFFRLGDFYEMFFEDALIGSRDMEIALTKKSCGETEKAPMCGVPYHAADAYISKLINKGHKVAICEQVSDPALSKGIVDREVVRIITPGTVLSQHMLSEGENNFLACIYLTEESAGLTYCDISTGEFSAVRISGQSYIEMLFAEIAKIQPKEIVLNIAREDDEIFFERLGYVTDAYLSKVSDDYFNDKQCSAVIRKHFKISTEKSIGLAKEDAGTIFFAVGGVLNYLKETQKQKLEHLAHIRIYDVNHSMLLDKATVKNLEITESLFEKKTAGSLLGVLDKTKTAMGSRKMKNWLKEPLISINSIKLRLNAVGFFCENLIFLNNIRENLKGIYDLERLSARIACQTANGKDLVALKFSLHCLPDLKAELSDVEDPLLQTLNAEIDDLQSVYQLIESAIVDEPGYGIKDGSLIRDDYSVELDQLKNSTKDGRIWIAGLEAKERERTGIKNLKVGYNRVFGYYIDISKSNLNNVPNDYIRKQTLVGSERYITPELKEIETIVLNAEEKINELEYHLFLSIRNEILKKIPILQVTSSALSSIDVLASFAEVSLKLNYVKPILTNGDKIIVKKGRHAVIENTIKDGVFVSNDLYMDRETAGLLLITGPNMAGKSTYMRQLALIVLMAQAGCFVPAESAEIGICDRIYTRIGASDNISQGQSTFFVEMSELAYILNTATGNSLVILDEIGRGTSTYDGLSIAWAVCEFLAAPNKSIRTLFATHYHELTSLLKDIKIVKNLNVDVVEHDGNIVFLHKIVEGSASRSYGIHVAKIAGVPETVLWAAENNLVQLEALTNNETPYKKSNSSKEIYSHREEQMNIFSVLSDDLKKKIECLDLMNITPSDAIGVLDQIQTMVKGT
ncbi:MAG: DNA mismatch repair protein MutS [Clostridia bacterium]|nr:DNA mismatch repair protein MutS [Clostridia bacterium]